MAQDGPKVAPAEAKMTQDRPKRPQCDTKMVSLISGSWRAKIPLPGSWRANIPHIRQLEYQGVKGHYQVVNGHYQGVNGHFQVANGHYQVIVGQYQEVIGEYQVIAAQYQGRTGLTKPSFGSRNGSP